MPGKCSFTQGFSIAVAARDQRDAFDAAADRHVGALVEDLVGGHRDGLQAGGAEAVDGRAGDRPRQSGPNPRDAGDVHALLAFRITAADDHVFNLGRIELRHAFEHRLDAVGDQVVRPRQVERAAERFRQRRSQTCDNDGFTCHGACSHLPEINRSEVLCWKAGRASPLKIPELSRNATP